MGADFGNDIFGLMGLPQQYQVNIQSGLSGLHSPDALQNRRGYGNELAGLSNAASQLPVGRVLDSNGHATSITVSLSPGTVIREEPEPRKRHWLLSWLPKSDPVIGRDFHPKKTLTELEKWWWSN